MIYQKIDGIQFKLKSSFNFSFLEKYGKVFKVFDEQDSGNICFGINNGGNKKLFIKFAGAPTAEYCGLPGDAVKRLKATVPIYNNIKHKTLINYISSEEIGHGFAMVFEWCSGECMGRMYEDSHKRFMNLPIQKKLKIFQDIIDFLIYTANLGYVAIDFYDGSILYDNENDITTVCDIDFFKKCPCINDMGKMWGSTRFMSPEEYNKGALLDEITNVFTIGKMGFSIFTDSNEKFDEWPLSPSSYYILKKATSLNRSDRYASIKQFSDCWINSVEKFY